ncbi:MAG: hypothetical protein JNG86_15350 [Verrucomicrobiaceae bacterium]|nr:hypothetical protein [Verrucomicrobiaceae bacterium]
MTTIRRPDRKIPLVVGIGAATLDDLVMVPRFCGDEAVIEGAARCRDVGGPVATALSIIALHGRTDCQLIDGWGDDAACVEICKALSDCGVGTTGVRTTAGAVCAHAVILVRQTDGARQIIFTPSTAPEPVFEPRMLHGARLLHMNGRHENACRAAIAAARVQNVEISFDGGAGRFRESIRDFFEASHLRIVSRDFAEKASGSTELAAMAAKLLQPPARLLVITEGVRGSHVWTPDGAHFHQPAFPAEPVIDTTGCGDVFHGAFLHGWLSEWPLERCAAYAARLAAKNAEGPGGRHVLKAAGKTLCLEL